MSEQKNNRFVVMWDCHGLEAVAVLPDPALATWARLQNQEPPQPPNLLHWKLRAQFNPQRHYEIYLFDVAPGIGKDDIVDWFAAAPQAAADRVREIGHCFYSNRAPAADKILIQ